MELANDRAQQLAGNFLVGMAVFMLMLFALIIGLQVGMYQERTRLIAGGLRPVPLEQMNYNYCTGDEDYEQNEGK